MEQNQHDLTSPAEQTPDAGKRKKKKKLPKWGKVLLTIVIIVAILALLLSRCASRGTEMLAGAYLPAQAVRQDLTVSVSGTGTIQPIHSYKLTTLVQGEVLEAPFEEGDTVAEGDLLYRIDSKDVENTIARAELSLQQAQLTYEDLLTNQKNAALTAPKAGTVQKLYVEEGDTVSAGAQIADILDRSTMTLELPFHSADAAGFAPGQSAAVTVDGTLETLAGTVSKISAADQVSAGGALVRTVTIEVRNPGALSPLNSGTAVVGGAACAGSGAFSYRAQATLYAKTSGEIGSLSVREGDLVAKGQTIAVFATDSISTQIESARLSVESARLTLQNARDQLDNYSISSPISCTVIEKNLEVGDTMGSASASTAQYPAVIYDLSTLTFDMQIHELDIKKIRVGQEVRITADALDGQEFTGRVDKVNINGATVGGVTTYPVTIVVEDPRDLLPGMNVSATIVVGEQKDTLCIPVDAVSRGNTVLVALPGCLNEDGTVADPTRSEERTLVLGQNNDAYIEVLSGLEEGETVLQLNQGSDLMSTLMGGR